jgi:hypothetical protein
MASNAAVRFLRRSVLPAAVFGIVLALHYLYLGLFPEGGSASTHWALPEDMPTPSWWRSYVETQSYFLGFSYALSLAFATWALRRYREERLCGARNLAIGGITLSGFFAVAGCYLLGCCGSPMLVVYLNLFGASFLPLARPLVALITLLSVAAAAWWLLRRSRPKCAAIR